MTKRDKRLLYAALALFLAPHLIVWSWDAEAGKAAESEDISAVDAIPAVALAEELPEVQPWSIDMEDPDEDAKIEAALVEQGYFREDVPLPYEEQDYLHTACEEFGVDYPLMLALIEHETNFRNVQGDSGESAGYCQIQRKWWAGLMEKIGAEDLNDPYDNFRTACAILSGLTERYGNVRDALSAYNTGSPGHTKYADAVLAAAERWE